MPVCCESFHNCLTVLTVDYFIIHLIVFYCETYLQSYFVSVLAVFCFEKMLLQTDRQTDRRTDRQTFALLGAAFAAENQTIFHFVLSNIIIYC